MQINGDFRFIQKVVVFHTNKFLIIQRSDTDKNAPKKWDLPGGNIEWGEKPDEAVIREVFEETGIKLKDLVPIAVTNINREKMYAIAIIYKSITEDTVANLSSEHQAYKWVSLEEYSNYEIQPWIKEKLVKLLA